MVGNGSMVIADHQEDEHGKAANGYRDDREPSLVETKPVWEN